MGRRRSLLATARHWLTPGIGVKRWLVMLVLGASLMGLGVIYVLLAFYTEALVPERFTGFLVLAFLPIPVRVILPLVLGFLLVSLAIARLSRNLLEPFRRPGDSVGRAAITTCAAAEGRRSPPLAGVRGCPACCVALRSSPATLRRL
jgi:hypothetical protein